MYSITVSNSCYAPALLGAYQLNVVFFTSICNDVVQLGGMQETISTETLNNWCFRKLRGEISFSQPRCQVTS